MPLNERLIIQRGNLYVQYDFLSNEIYKINGKNYGLVDYCFYFYPDPQKGKLLTTVDGMNVYEFVGNDKAVLIDIAPIVCAGIDDAESLYVAELMNRFVSTKKHLQSQVLFSFIYKFEP